MATNVVDYLEIDIDSLEFNEPKESERSKGQKISFPNYKNGRISYIKFPEIYLDMYGILPLGDFVKDDSARSFIKIPINPEYNKIKPFIEFLQLLDNKFGSDEYKTKLFGSKAKKYDYCPILRTPNEEEEEDKPVKSEKKKIKRQPYMKLKLKMNYENNNIDISVIVDKSKPECKKDLQIVEDVNTIDKLKDYVCFRSEIVPIVKILKLWAQPVTTMKNSMYGITFQVDKIKTKLPISISENTKEFMTSYCEFLNSDSEDDTHKKSSSSTQAADLNDSPTIILHEDENEESNEDEDDCEDEDEEEIEEK